MEDALSLDEKQRRRTALTVGKHAQSVTFGEPIIRRAFIPNPTAQVYEGVDKWSEEVEEEGMLCLPGEMPREMVGGGERGVEGVSAGGEGEEESDLMRRRLFSVHAHSEIDDSEMSNEGSRSGGDRGRQGGIDISPQGRRTLLAVPPSPLPTSASPSLPLSLLNDTNSLRASFKRAKRSRRVGCGDTADNLAEQAGDVRAHNAAKAGEVHLLAALMASQVCTTQLWVFRNVSVSLPLLYSYVSLCWAERRGEYGTWGGFARACSRLPWLYSASFCGVLLPHRMPIIGSVAMPT